MQKPTLFKVTFNLLLKILNIFMGHMEHFMKCFHQDQKEEINA
jgi:hypothetical protein